MADFPQIVLADDQLDESADNPSLARPQLLAAVQTINQIMESGDAPNGVALLDEDGYLKNNQLRKDEPNGVPSLDENTRISGFRLPVGPGLGVDAITEQVRLKRGLENDSGTVKVENSGSSFLQSIVIDENGLIIRVETGVMPSLTDQQFTSYFSTEAQAIAAIPVGGLYTGTQTRQAQTGTTQQCTTSTGKNPITTCQNVPTYSTQYRAIYLIQ